MLARKNEKQTLKPSSRFGAMVLLCAFLVSAFGQGQSEMDWPAVTKISRPWTYWWWMGSAVDKPNLTQHLEVYRKAGIGGVNIYPIYGVRGFEQRFISYLSPKWMEMLEHTIKEAERLDMGVDMVTGTGWPFGGKLRIKDAAAKVILKTYTLDAGTCLSERIRAGTLQALMAYSDKGEIVDITNKVDEKGVLDWVAPAGKWELYAALLGRTGQQVKRAAPGAEGNVLDHFSGAALKKYLERFDRAFASYPNAWPRAFYNDSYEVFGADWTSDFFEEFKSRRGYDLRRYLAAFSGKGTEDEVARVKCDYRETISDLLLERFTIGWVKWSHDKGSVTCNEAHGSPGNLLDLYAAADIPETEIFGPNQEPLMSKFASSAAHVTGKRLVSSESFTWLGEHFKVALWQVKPEMDKLLVSGINHIFYHGMTYSPFDDFDEPWPGWLFYASVNFGPSNSFWRDFPELNTYIARCQSFLQSGQPDNDILLYFPVYDLWHNKDGLLYQFTVHNTDKWLHPSEFHKAAETLWQRGYTFDYVSDRLLMNAKISSDKIQMGNVKYSVVVIPKCRFIPLKTLEKLLKLAEEGATIVVQSELPGDVPGLGNLSNRRELFKQALATIKLVEAEQPGVREAIIGKGRLLIGGNLEQMLELSGTTREPIVDFGIEFIRRAHPQGHHYFLTNLSKQHLDGWVRLGVKAESAVIFEPLSAKRGLASVRQSQTGPACVYLQLKPGQSYILRTFSSKKVDGPKWRYLRESGEPYEIKGTWNVIFIEGGPRLPADFETETLASWTELGDSEAKRFAGTARYTVSFDKPTNNADDWVLDLGRVCESGRVKINGRCVGTLWSIPFRTAIGQFLQKGKNVLEVEVTNLSANRIADMDRRGVVWKKFYDINFVDIKYRPFNASGWPAVDSGLLGPVRLIPAQVAN